MTLKAADIDWYTCTCEASDVAYGNALPKTRDPDYHALKKASKHLEPRHPGRKVGDVMWRTATGIGPLYVEHDHWSGYHLGVTEKQAERIAKLISEDPDFPWEDE